MKTIFAHFSRHRSPDFQIATAIIEHTDGSRMVKKTCLTEGAGGHLARIAANGTLLSESLLLANVQVNKIVSRDSRSLTFEYIDGVSFEDRLLHAFAVRDKNRYLEIIAEYYNLICTMSRTVSSFRPGSCNADIFGDLDLSELGKENSFLEIANLDLVFGNILLKNSTYCLIDYEWVFRTPVPPSFLLFRALLNHNFQYHVFSGDDFLSLNEILAEYSVDQARISLYWEMETRFQAYVNGSTGLQRYSAGEAYKQVQQLLQSGRIAEGIAAVELFIEAHPYHAAAHRDLGVFYLNKGIKEKGLVHFERALALAPANTMLLKDAARLYVAESRFERAVGIFIKLLEVNPRDTDACMALGRIFMLTGRAAEAAGAFKAALSIEPDNQIALELLTKLQVQTGDKGAAGGPINTATYEKGTIQNQGVDTMNAQHDSEQPNSTNMDTPTVICILGMHRSGTSMITQLLHQCGLYLGSPEDIIGSASDNPDGFWENTRFVGINDELLRLLGGAWDSPPLFESGWVNRPEIEQMLGPARKLIETFQHKGPWGWKDPRNSLTSLFWKKALGPVNIKYVVCVRNPLEVARSINKRSYNSFIYGYKLWYTYNKAIMENTRVNERIISHYDTFFSHPQQELRRLVDFLGIPATDDIIETSCKKISGSLRHHALDLDDLKKAVVSHDLISLYEDLCHEAIRQRETVSIVILTFNEMKYTRECVESIRKYTPESHEIIFVDNCSTDGTVKWLRELVSSNRNYRLIENNKNRGFATGCNQGIQASSGEYILLLNNDVVVTEHWLSGMLACLRSRPDTGIVGPMTNNISGTQKDPSAHYSSMPEMHLYAAQFREMNLHRRIPLRRIVGFCMLFRRDLADKIGLLDENFGTGNFEDDDYCLRAALEGYRNFIAGDVFIHHYGSRTFKGNKINYAETLGGHRKVFSEKWSTIQRNSDLGRKFLLLNVSENAADLCSKGEADKAVTACIESIGQFPDRIELYQTLGELLLNEKRFQEALDALAAMPESGGEEPRTLLIIGYCKEGLQLNDEAEVYADKVLGLLPDEASALNLKGMLAYKGGEQNTAEAYFTRAISSAPGYGEPYTNLGVMRWTDGQKEDGLSLLEKGFYLSPQLLDSAALYHSAAVEKEIFPVAEKRFREAKALYPQNQRITFLLIDILLKQAKETEAMQVIEEAMTVFALSDGLLHAALAVREKIGPMRISQGNRKSLSFSMIVKNEEKHIAKCLMSIKPVADEIIVVDTGSTDRTKDIALALGARLFDLEWKGDFSEARNHSLVKAEGGWIFSLDADEVISSADHQALRRIVEKGKPVAYKITTRNYSNQVGSQGFIPNKGDYPREEIGLGWFPSTKVRLFPHDKRIHFENPVHEFVDGTIERARIPIMLSEIPVHHYGRLDEGKLREKGEAYYQLGRKKLDEKGGADLKAIFELGVQAGELKKYDEAATLFERLIQIEPLYPLALFNLGFAYLELGRFAEALPHARKGYELNPEKKECALNVAHCEIVVGDNSRAVDMLEDILKKEPEYPPAMALLAAAYSIQGAPACYGILETLHSRKFDCSFFLHELAEALTSEKRYKQALNLFELIIKSGNTREKTKELLEQCYQKSTRKDLPDGPVDHLKGLNPYDRQLTRQEVDQDLHRAFVGGMWDELGSLQFNFMKAQGLEPGHALVDVGCGALRGGLHFISYLNKGNYYGLDLNASIIEAGRKELERAGIADREPHLLVNNAFEMSRFNTLFDFGLAVSVFTHLPMNHIIRCLAEIEKVLKPRGLFFATFFQAPLSAHTGTIHHSPGGVVTNYDSDPFHYSLEEIAFMASAAGLTVRLIGDWSHPRDQRMLVFSRPDNA